MFGSVTLEVFIGLALLYLVLSLIVSAAQELIASLLRLRAKDLAKGVRTLLDDPDNKALADALTDEIYRHPAIFRLYKGKGRAGKFGPSYLPASSFVTAMLDVLRSKGAGDAASVDALSADELVQRADQIVASLPDEYAHLKKALTLYVGHAANGHAHLRARAESTRRALEDWYDEAMDRVSGWYKRKAQYIGLFVGLVLAVMANVDTIAVAESLWTNQTLRASVVQSAEAFADASGSATETPTAELIDIARQFPIGWREGADWSTKFSDRRSAFQSVVGWLLTALAIGVGSGFWFNALSRLLALRASGRRPLPTQTRSQT